MNDNDSPNLSLSEWNDWRTKQGMPPMPPNHFQTREMKRNRTVSLTDTAYSNLQTLAEYLHYATYKSGNVSLLMEAIGRGLISLKSIHSTEELNIDDILNIDASEE